MYDCTDGTSDVQEGLGKTVLVRSDCDGITWYTLANLEPCAKNLVQVFRMIQNTDLSLDAS